MKYIQKLILGPIRQHTLFKRSSFKASAGSDQKIYLFGGQGLKKDINSVEKYDPVSDTGTFDKPKPTAYILESVPFGNNVYVIGGQLFTHPGRVALSLNEIFHIRRLKKLKLEEIVKFID